MNRGEVALLTAVVKAYWPHWQAGESREEAEVTVNVWLRQLGDIDPDIAAAAVDVLHAEAREFAPTPGIVRERAITLRAQALGEAVPDVDQAWHEVQTAVRDRGWYQGPPDEWSHPAVAFVVSSLGWDELCHSDNPEALRAHFIRLYQVGHARSRAEALIPPTVRAVLDAIRPPEIEPASGFEHRVEAPKTGSGAVVPFRRAR